MVVPYIKPVIPTIVKEIKTKKNNNISYYKAILDKQRKVVNDRIERLG